ncbi:MAG: hypothetical protein A3I29_01535 [Candidatus Magasanikbacteria bacterium RIFCSPLOWO2_02_FULL_44_11]|uniref:Uridylate kinase n=2 Tax=Candidatus Magasanikiibacteriota TaxID=1752731 RepID=A0A1F6NAN1_9BACT|nr:MAG: hypothetical protein A3D53_00105 [Candidatus Magasanikbacteria bacterium RIFCSPHIGHO2_02_FULL_45_10]OGH80763.1 MAG: hypothetical protein A3I29_01535 [Candidatus Magasanikbacteria bacterium RIFCSPLOWO2_02_FULL_44_11]
MQSGFNVISVGGSIIIPQTGFDSQFLKQFRDLIIKQVKSGKKFILVIGGGATARQYQAAAKNVGIIDREELDYIGIAATVLNANFVKRLFGDLAYAEVVTNPTKKVKTSKPIIIAAGWKPGCSTDTDAVLMAKTYDAKAMYNLSNIDYVYTSDPKTNPTAEKIMTISWRDFRKIIGDEWNPGANLPFDPIAAKTAEKLKLTVGFVRGDNLVEVEQALSFGQFNGTTIR